MPTYPSRKKCQEYGETEMLNHIILFHYILTIFDLETRITFQKL